MAVPRLAVTLGDPSGIGPEIVAKALLRSAIYRRCRPVVIGDKRLLSILPGAIKSRFDVIDIPVSGRQVSPGKISRASGMAAYVWLMKAVELARCGRVRGIVTAPISKEALALAGIGLPGHTELLAGATGTKNFAMMMAAGRLRAVMVTRHRPLMSVGAALSVDEIVRAGRLCASFLTGSLSVKVPRIGLCALNPHAGEGGMIGKEECLIIAPAMRALRRKGVHVSGVLPADSAWRKMNEGSLDALITMYHDQAMIPLKCLAPEKIVNITLGLPFVRTSPGHGTAPDIAGKNIADPSPMIEAIKTAADLCAKKLNK